MSAMTGRKAKGMDLAIAKAAALTESFDVGRVVRRVVWNIAASAALVLAASRLDGWLSVAMAVLAVTRLLPYLFAGLGQRVLDEKNARLKLIPEPYKTVLTTKTIVFGGDTR